MATRAVNGELRWKHSRIFVVWAALMGRLSLALAYSSHPNNNNHTPNSVPGVHVWKIQAVNTASAISSPLAAPLLPDSHHVPQHPQQHRQVFYDLGLGKNPPLVPKTRVQQPAVAAMKAPFLKPKRQTFDVLHIEDHFKYSPSFTNPPDSGASDPRLPRMAWSSYQDRIKLDVNTIWVEMLLHHQQQDKQDWFEANSI